MMHRFPVVKTVVLSTDAIITWNGHVMTPRFSIVKTVVLSSDAIVTWNGADHCLNQNILFNCKNCSSEHPCNREVELHKELTDVAEHRPESAPTPVAGPQCRAESYNRILPLRWWVGGHNHKVASALQSWNRIVFQKPGADEIETSHLQLW